MENDVKWMPISGYHNFYEVSNNGQVRSLDRTIVYASGQIRRIKGRTLIPKYNGVGYLFVTLCRCGKTQNHYLHRLVAKAFLPNVSEKAYVNHIDGDSINNMVDNLEWVDHSENVRHAYNTNLNNNKRGKHNMAVGVVDNTLGKRFNTIKEWCEARGINYSTGRNIVSGNNKSKIIDANFIIRINKSENERGNEFRLGDESIA